jgi:Cu2+-exporting ATPase
VEKAQELKLPRAKMDETKYHLGFGIFAVINDRNVKIGSMRFMEKEGIEILQEIKEQVHESMNRGGCGVMVSFDDVLAGAIILESSERLEAYDVVQALKKRKKKVILISGDHEAPTKILCQRLGIDEYYYEKLPHEKADFVRALQSQGKKVAMVGDGVNDSIALSLADTSVSLRGASDIAMDVADVVFMDGSLVKLEALYQVAEGLDKTIKKCFKMILVPNSLCIFGALMGIVQLGMSLILNNFANIAASINATLPLRHLHQTPETGKEGK